MPKLVEIIVQVLVLIFIIIGARASYRIAKWSCAHSVQWLTAGFIYILVWRAFFTIIHAKTGGTEVWVEAHQSYFIVPAYAMWAWGLTLLYKMLTNLGRTK